MILIATVSSVIEPLLSLIVLISALMALMTHGLWLESLRKGD
jgi:hypothetical protein